MVTSAKQHRYPCPGPPTDSVNLPEMRFEFLLILIGQSTMAFLTGPGGDQEQGFGCCFADGLNQSSRVLVSFVVQANCCLRSSFWFSCTPVPFDCFCGAGYWSTPPHPPLRLYLRCQLVHRYGYCSHRVDSRDNLTFPAIICIYFTPRIPTYHLRCDAKGKINAQPTAPFVLVSGLNTNLKFHTSLKRTIDRRFSTLFQAPR